ncbi:MAG TPA: hypothetical protein VM101_12990, partial [Flavitalea sp.]|nr:hypothetical protein [Flavitalea sp.]
ISNYPVFNYARQYDTYRDTLQDLMKPVHTVLEAINKYCDSADKQKLKVIICEYGPFDWAGTWPFINNTGYNLVNFEMTGDQLCEPKVAFSCFWNTRWIDNDSVENSVFDAFDKNGNFNANGWGLAIWGKYLGEKMVKVKSTTQVRVFACTLKSPDKLRVFVINKSYDSSTVRLNISSAKIKHMKLIGRLLSKGVQDTDPVWSTSKQKVGAHQLLQLPGVSISVYELKVK